MTSNTVLYNEIEKIYNRDEKSKRFITHLIRSYLPLTNVKVIEKSSEKLTCSLSKKSLKSISDVSDSTDNLSELLIKDIAFKIDFSKDAVEINISEPNTIAYTGSNTKTFLSQEAYIALIQFVANSVKSDKHIEWLIRKMEIKSFLNTILGIVPSPKKKNTNNKPTFKRVPVATTTLGDLEALQELRKKMNS